MVNFILGPTGSGKSTKIIDCIRNQSLKNKKIYVVIPEQFSFEYERKLYNELGSSLYNSINVLSFTRLAKTIFDTFGNRSGEYADENTKTILMYLTLKEIEENKSLVCYTKQIKSRSFINDALSIVSDLRRASVSPQTLSAKLLSADSKIRDKGYDLSLIYTTYDRIMNEYGYKDSLTDITQAAALANMNDYFKNSVFFVDEFDSFSPDEREMLDSVISDADEFYISLCTEDINQNEFSLFSTVNSTYHKIKNIASKYNITCRDIVLTDQLRFKNDGLAHMSKSIFRKKGSAVSADEYVKITEAKDLYQESDFVCSYIKYLIREKGYRYSDISIALRQPEDYEIILNAALDRYDIPFFIDTEKPIMHTSVVLVFTSLIEMIGTPVLETDTILRYAKTHLAGISVKDTAILENYCFRWNINGHMWENEFTVTSKTAPDDVEYIENIRNTLVVPVIELRERCSGKSAAQICRYVYEFIESQNISSSVSQLAAAYSDAGLTDMSSEIIRLWDSIMDMFDCLSSILGEQKISASVFRELFTLMLKQNRFLSPPQKIDIVSIVSAEKARLNSSKVIFIMGVNEGILPYAVKPSGLLSDFEKESFAAIGIDISKDTQRLLTDERFTVYRLLSFASERVILSYSLSDASGEARYPSYIIPQISNLFSDNIKCFASGYDILFYSPTIKSAYYNYVMNYFNKSVKSESLREALMTIPEYAAKIQYLDTLRPDADHRIEDKELMKKLLSDRLVISATSFQEYNLCHFKYYCHYGLKIASRNQKEINFLELGNLVHMCLENIFAQCSSKQEFIEMTDEQITDKIKKFAREYKESNLGGDFGKNARLDTKFDKLAEDTLTLVNHLKEELRQSEFIPVKYEFEISERNGVKPLTIKTSQGIEIILNGKIDRVDMFEDGGEKFIRVIDYKTGEQVFSIKNILFGIDMQMLLYLFSITGEGSPFGNTVPAGVLYMPSGKIALERERGNSQEKNSYLNKFYHMNGVVLRESRVLSAMEENIEGIYIPAKLTADARKKGTFVLDKVRTSCLTRVQFERLRDHAGKLIRSMADELYSGNISASPLSYDKNKDVCSYCDYWDICGNIPRIRERIIPDDIEKIKSEVLGDDGEDTEK